ncbi:PKD domain-containing protein [Kitasatospora mediocidica]|uniref:PKD domain-containing protein n=1 Tax=Kitasatospora mediocidica TaxID=58352 RepID=UPI0005634ED9|nr:right-handed parallel beta-helix repeat-containing protein [Kitasatospora mediocidica]
MRLHNAVGLGAAAITAVLGLPVPAASADVSTLYVSQVIGCSDAGVGSQQTPYCTIAAAADAAQPGQTVRIAPGRYGEQLHLTRSGTPGHPITFAGGPLSVQDPTPSVTIEPTDAGTPALSVSGVHDVRIERIAFEQPTVSATITDSSQVALDQTSFWGDYYAKTVQPPALRVTGRSSDVTVGRSDFQFTGGVSIEAGTQRTTLTTDHFFDSSATAVSAVDAVGTVLTSNTLSGGPRPALSLAGASTGSSVENNILTGNRIGTVPADGTGDAELLVSAGSAAHTTVDYNVVDQANGGGGVYSWAGRNYQPAAFRAATGQGAHDLDDATPLVRDGAREKLSEASPAIDSADPAAPGMLSTDLLGDVPVDDPKVANTAPAGGYRDRGAYEFEGLTAVSLSADPAQGPAALLVTATARVSNSWPGPVSYSFDFGDGSAPVVTTDPSAQHLYPAKGSYQVGVTVTDSYGGRLVSTPASEGNYASLVTVGEPGDLVPKLTTQGIGLLEIGAGSQGSTGPWRITGYSFDFGDNTPAETGASSAQHTYRQPGSYTVTLTEKDQGGRTAVTRNTVQVGYTPAGYVPVAPTRVYDSRTPELYHRAPGARPVGPGETLYVPVDSVPSGATAIVANITATDATASTHLDVSPAGQQPTGTSNLNVVPGQTVANLVTVSQVGTRPGLNITNLAGSVHVVVDVLGYYLPNAKDGYSPVAPARLLDTRDAAGGKLAPFSWTSLQVTGRGAVPVGADAVVLNLTATEPTATGYLAVRPSGRSGPPTTSSLNFTPGQTVPGQVIVPVGPDGRIDIYNHSGSTHAVADVLGYYSADSKGLFTPVPPTRLVDTRDAGGHPVAGGTALGIQVGGAGGVPAGATAAVLNLTETAPTGDGFLTAYPDGIAPPNTSNVNFVAGQTTQNHTLVPIGADGRVEVLNHGAGSTQLIADLFGYFTNG